MPRISKRIIATLQPAEKDYIVWDDQVAGFALRVWPSGRMSYVVHYRTNGRFRRYTIGHHGPWTADKARDEAIRILARVKDGGDPNVERGEERSCPTVRQFSKTFVERHVNTHLKPTTQAEHKRAIDLLLRKDRQPEDGRPHPLRCGRVPSCLSPHSLSGQPDPGRSVKNVLAGDPVGRPER
ncbi:Arm DNA-binding domain-containing protein [Komagataeibacter rhaeticus]|nr:Arm DNA-binding domain-containing protein [Komagataeibacter rhaeticus]